MIAQLKLQLLTNFPNRPKSPHTAPIYNSGEMITTPNSDSDDNESAIRAPQ